MSFVTGSYPEKAWVTRSNTAGIEAEYQFQFNPTTISRNTTAQYTLVSPPGSTDPTAIFRSISGKTLDISILVDSTTSYFRKAQTVALIESGNPFTTVDLDIAFWESLAFPDIGPFLEGGGKWTSPPRILFGYGLKYWHVVVTSVSVTEQMFDQAMRCMRAQIDVSMQSIWTTKEDNIGQAKNFDLLRSAVEIRGSAKEEVEYLTSGYPDSTPTAIPRSE